MCKIPDDIKLYSEVRFHKGDIVKAKLSGRMFEIEEVLGDDPFIYVFKNTRGMRWHGSDGLELVESNFSRASKKIVNASLENIHRKGIGDEENEKECSDSDFKQSDVQTLTLPLVKGVEEFWGYFEDSQGHIWYAKATKTSRGDKND